MDSMQEKCKTQSNIKNSIQTPDFSNLNLKKIQNIEEEILDIIEWFGMVQIDSDWIKDGIMADPFISVYSPPLNSSIKDLSVIESVGIIHPSKAAQIVKYIL